MQISKYRELICRLPVRAQSSSAKEVSWFAKQNPFLDHAYRYVFEIENGFIEIDRQEIFDEQNPMHRFLKTIFWGYPTKGRGNNLKNVMSNSTQILMILEEFKGKNMTKVEYHDVITRFATIKGLGASTWTKFFYFFELSIEDKQTLIFDNQIIQSLKRCQFNDFDKIKHLRKENANHYLEYIRCLNNVANDIECTPEQLELFLFYFNNNYKL